MAEYAVCAHHAIDLPGGALAGPGAIVELDETVAAPLVESGSLVAVEAADESTPENQPARSSARAKKGSDA